MRNSIRSRGWGERAWDRLRGRTLGTVAAALTLTLATTLTTGAAWGGERGPGRDESIGGRPSGLSIGRRAVIQDQGAWVVDFAIRNESAAGVVVVPDELEARVEGWVSNSRVAGHSRPILARATVGGRAGGTAEAELIASKTEAGRCNERLTLSVWSDDAPPPPGPSTTPPAPISLAPGATGRVRLRIEHRHAVFGDYDPLLGVQTVDLRVGAETFRDAVPLDRERSCAQPLAGWPDPPEDRRDRERFFSPPDSLHLEAHAAGRQYYRFPDRPVRHGARMRLSFRYLIAVGTAGECRARFAQYKETPSSSRVLSSGGFDEPLTTVGRWVHVEKILHIEPEATTAALDFRIASDVDLGEMWIDDAELSPVPPDALVATP